jgi:DNA replication protein DnaC
MIEQTKSVMAELKWLGALHTLDQRLSDASAHGWGNAEFLSALLTDEKLYRDQSKTVRRIRAANFRTQATFERIDYTAKRTITKPLVKDLMTLSFLKQPRNVLITGATGVGKTYLATAIGEYACRSGFSCIFIGISVLIERLLLSRSDGTYLRYREKLIATDLLIIDDIGLKKIPSEIVIDLHDILEERQMRCTLITTQLPLQNWKEIIGDELALDTIVDKLKHGTLQLVIEGDTCRARRGQTRPLDKQSVPEEIEIN